MDGKGKDLSAAATVNMDDWEWNWDRLTPEPDTRDFAAPLCCWPCKGKHN